MSGTLLVVNDPAVRHRACRHALRPARALAGRGGKAVPVFLVDRAVSCAQGPAAFTHRARAPRPHRAKTEVGVSGSCMHVPALNGRLRGDDLLVCTMTPGR